MTAQEARKLVDLYVDGWKQSDKSKILEPLARDCFVTESHGPTYRNKKTIEQWVDEWLKTGKVTRWVIDSFFFSGNAAFFEWSFSCKVANKLFEIEGASVVLFKNGKISHIHEYRMTKPAFDWKADAR